MSKSFWSKQFIDGSLEVGTDKAIKNGLASWTKGRQDIIRTTLSFNDREFSLRCDPKNGKLASWEQYDNFVFSVSTGQLSRLSREVRCTLNGYKYLFISSSFSRSSNLYHLNDKVGYSIPKNTKVLVCFITMDGKVDYKWS